MLWFSYYHKVWLLLVIKECELTILGLSIIFHGKLLEKFSKQFTLPCQKLLIYLKTTFVQDHGVWPIISVANECHQLFSKNMLKNFLPCPFYDIFYDK